MGDIGEFKSSQLVGNVGLFYVCYQLSLRQWNTMPTSRNAKGVDIIIYSQDGITKHTIQVKSLSKRLGVPLGNKLENFIADYTIICWNVLSSPEVFINETKKMIQNPIRRDKQGKISYWLSPSEFVKYKDNWGVITH